MGDLIGGIIGGIGSLIGGASASSAEKDASKQALTGYNYLQSNPLVGAVQSNAQGNIANENSALGAQAGTVGDISSLLTSNGTNNPAFQNYLNSTGYNFQLQQGSDAITGNAASKGVLNSGSTAKALTTYGQNLASTDFNNYLGQLGSAATLQGQNAAGYTNTVNQGVGAAEAVGQAGTTGGANAAQETAAAGQSTGTSIANAFNTVGGGLQAGLNNGSIGNFFTTPKAPPVDANGVFL